MIGVSQGDDDEYVPPKPDVVEIKEDDAFYTVKLVLQALHRILLVLSYCSMFQCGYVLKKIMMSQILTNCQSHS